MSRKSDVGGVQLGKPLRKSIRLKTLLLILLMVFPLVLMGIAGTLYYQGIMKQNIQNDMLTQANTIAATTPDYMNTSQLYLQSIADRPLVIKAVEENDRGFLHSMAVYADQTNRINNAFFTDSNGTIIESTPGLANLIGRNMSDHAYVNSVLKTGNPVIDGAELGVDKIPVVPICVPVKNGNGTVIGAMVGRVDLSVYEKMILDNFVKPQQIFYMVNESGRVMIHTNPEYAMAMKDFTTVPPVQHVLLGEKGVADYYNPVENQSRLGAYAPIEPMGWGVIVALPRDLAYQSVWNATWLAAGLIVLFSLIALGLGWYFSNSLIAPITSMSQATKIAFKTDEYRKLLPLGREDEIGDLSRSFSEMVDTIKRESTERKRAEDELNSQKQRAELYLDLMSHDINNMMQIGIGFLELALERAEKDPEEKDYIEHALVSLYNSTKLIDNVRKLQKVETHELRRHPIDVCQLLSDVRSDFLNVPAREVSINLTSYCHCTVNANELLKDVFTNLVGNAIKHSTGTINIDIKVWNTYNGQAFCNISIEDNGPGITPEQKNKMFTRFQRGTTKAHGKGLGLHLVKALVEDFHGNIWVEDRIPGDYSKGSKFVIRLPVVMK